MSVEKFEILVEGYAKKIGDITKASSTVTFIQDNGIKIIVDPGMDREKLLTALKRIGITPQEIDFVVLTHYHLDHSLLAGIFENAKILDDGEIYSWNGEIKEHKGKVPGTDVQIIETPGHAIFHCCVVFEHQNYDKVCVAGDLFWWRDEENQEEDIKDLEKLINKEDPYKKDWKKLKESRKKILDLCDWIIPGHGKMFKVPV